MKYQPYYMPATDNDKLSNQPLFDTEQEAWDYIQDKYCHCGMEIDPNENGYCVACESEWEVVEV